MTRFLDVRYAPVGGGLAAQVNLNQGTDTSNYVSVSLSDLLAGIRGRHVLIATHGFNVDRAAGIACLSNWEGLLMHYFPDPNPFAFLGLLWPGDSIWAHGLDYPDEPKIADEAATSLLAPFIDANFGDAASVSFASHSLGARVVLATIEKMNRRVRRLTLMAGAIDDNCLNTEFAAAAKNIDTVSVLASKKDTVLSRLFPLGNFVAGIIAEGHPWWRAAIGHNGPAQTWPANFEAPFMIPDGWNFDHGNYLQINPPPVPNLTLPVEAPPLGTAPPGGGAAGWQEAFTAGFESSRFK
ncbi:MAG: alpha/beta hydrolase [Candidatus Sulfopaludibacter sp.]|nr:alpha/beta hydrolase [Candidatus Sulfopaludibacter sp.]